MPMHFPSPKKMFFVYEIRASPPGAATVPAAAPSEPLAIFGCECDCGLSLYTYLCCKDGRWAKMTANIQFKCVALLPVKEAHALIVSSSSWLGLLGVQECKHKLPLSWILPPEAIKVSSDNCTGLYSSLALLPGVLAKSSTCSPFRPLIMRLLSQQTGCCELPCWFVKTKYR
jgi:hypothetical protein